jgi:hypothetical protein
MGAGHDDGLLMEPDWRLNFCEGLRGQPLRNMVWRKWSEQWDHDHCAACGAKFAEFEGEGIQKVGYATTEAYQRGAEYEWVCETCFDELKEQLGWYEVK